jgi:hypothetical protein
MARSTPDAPLVRVITPWTASYTPALAVRRGEPLAFKGTDPDNPGWRWAENADGLGGWLPNALIDGDHLTEDFDSTELTVETGDDVTVLDRRAGWCLCRNRTGQRGWLPADCLKATAPPAKSFPKP